MIYALLKQMGKGLLVTDDGTRRQYCHRRLLARGGRILFENGEIQYPVSEISIAGNLSSMFKGVLALAVMSTLAVGVNGSVLIEQMQVAGQ